MEEIELANKEFKNYYELCDTLGWERKNGRAKVFQMKKLKDKYEVEFKGHQIIIGDKKKAKHFNEEFENKKEEYNKTLDILNTTKRNSQYISNNLLLFIHYLKTNEDNKYGTYTIRQMREFGFLRDNLRPDYFTPQEEVNAEGPTFKINDKFEKDINDRLTELEIPKNCQTVFREIFGFLRDRYSKIMDASCAKFVNEESIASFGAWITKAQWEYFKKRYNESINLMRREMEMIGIIDEGNGEYSERPLTSKETDTYFRIRNEIMEQEGVNKLKYEDMSRSQTRLFTKIVKACSEELGFMVTYRKLYYSPLKDLNAFDIDKVDVENARNDNNQKIKKTLEVHFKNKYLLSRRVCKIYEDCINYITDIKVA